MEWETYVHVMEEMSTNRAHNSLQCYSRVSMHAFLLKYLTKCHIYIFHSIIHFISFTLHPFLYIVQVTCINLSLQTLVTKCVINLCTHANTNVRNTLYSNTVQL